MTTGHSGGQQWKNWTCFAYNIQENQYRPHLSIMFKLRALRLSQNLHTTLLSIDHVYSHVTADRTHTDTLTSLFFPVRERQQEQRKHPSLLLSLLLLLFVRE